MFINKLKAVFVFLVVLSFFLSPVGSASARDISQKLSGPSANPPVLPAQIGDLIVFSEFVPNDIYLNGPFDAENIYFSLPANWLLTAGAQLNLSMAVSFNQGVQNVPGVTQGSPGNITVTLNDVFVGVIPIESAGEVAYQLPIPFEALTAIREDGLYKLRFFLESGWSCEFDENMLIVLHTSSSMTLPHESTQPDTNLINFPSPLYQRNSIYSTPLLVVIPDNPTAAELQSAMTIGAGFGNISSSRLFMGLSTASQLTTEQITNNNLVLIGKIATLPLLSSLTLPLPVDNGAFTNSGGNPDDGIIQLINSPWNQDNVILIVSGNTDAAAIKAAQAISTGSLRSNIDPGVAIVDVVKAEPIPVSPRVDQTLSDMGYEGEELKDVGVNYAEYKFYIPPGQTITKDAYFDLQFGHSSLLQYDRSGIVVTVNGKPIGSISLSEESARQAVNQVRFSIPPITVFPGSNSLEVKISLIPVDRCTNPDLEGVYANIWGESNLHLPIVRAVTSPIVGYDLISYPAPFTYDSTLNSMAFVFQKNDLNSWREAFKVAGYLGDRSNGHVTTLSTFYADDLPEAERSKYDFIMIGRPSQLPIINEINNNLPAPFDFGQDVALEPEMQVKYRINPNAAVGYVQTLSSPWNEDNVILTALGNDDQGVSWAVSHLIAPLSYKLSGNFAVINDLQVYTADTRLTILTQDITSTQVPVLEILPPAIGNPRASVPYRPAWLLPTLIIALLLIVLTVAFVIYMNWFRNRSNISQPAVFDQKEE